MLVGNKCDRVTEREVSVQEGSALAKQLNCDFVEASAKNCINVEKAFYDVVRQLRRQRANAPSRQLTGAQDGVYANRNKASKGYGYDSYEDERRREERYYRNRGRDRDGKKKSGTKCVIL
jgi:GTPase KRas protein